MAVAHADSAAGAAPKVAVVIPAFNASGTIDAALASVAAQSRRPNEVFVIDDASSDDTVARAARWSEILPITVLRQPENTGPAAARHAAISACRSLLIALLDADDVWMPDHLQVVTDLYQSVGGIISARALRWIPGTGLAPAPEVSVPRPDAQLEAVLEANFVFSGALFSVEDYWQVDGFRSGTAEDWDLWVRMIRAGSFVHFPTHATVVYQLSTGSRTNSEHTLTNEIGVLERAVAEAGSPAESRIARRSLRRYRARRSLADAYSLARAGHAVRARLRGIGALAGPRPVVLRAIALLAAPRWAVQVRDSKRFEPSRWLHR